MRERRKKARLSDRTVVDEKRSYVRVPKRNALRFREFNFTDEPPRYFDAHYKDISGGGILFESPHPFRVGSILKIEIKLPGWDRYLTGFYRQGSTTVTEPFVALAEVVRAETVTQDERYDIGVVFVGIDEGHREALMRLVADHFSR